jgi:hypothetical protein
MYIHELFASRFVCISIFGVGFVDLDENMANTGLCKKKKKSLTKLAPLLKDEISDPC